MRRQNPVQTGTNQKVIKNNNDELEIENYPKKRQSIIQQPKFKPPNSPNCKWTNRLEFDKGYYCRNCEKIINKKTSS